MEDQKTKPLRMTASSLDGRDFSNMNLENADFSFSSLKETNFDGANLRNAKLRFSSLERTSFKNTDLRNADLSFSSLNSSVSFMSSNQGVPSFLRSGTG